MGLQAEIKVATCSLELFHHAVSKKEKDVGILSFSNLGKWIWSVVFSERCFYFELSRI